VITFWLLGWTNIHEKPYEGSEIVDVWVNVYHFWLSNLDLPFRIFTLIGRNPVATIENQNVGQTSNL